MQAALREGLDVRGVRFPGGSFCDIGTPEELRAAVLAGATVPEGAEIPECATVEDGAGDPAGGAPAEGRHDGTEEDERT
jgi:NDP-sugar pyrophosphorylase family protein